VLPENGWACNPSMVDRSRATEAALAGLISMASDNSGLGGSEFPCSTLEKNFADCTVCDVRATRRDGARGSTVGVVYP
jgi:hypothetical protein